MILLFYLLFSLFTIIILSFLVFIEYLFHFFEKSNVLIHSNFGWFHYFYQQKYSYVFYCFNQYLKSYYQYPINFCWFILIMNDSIQNFYWFFLSHSYRLVHSLYFLFKFMISKFINLLNFNEVIQYLFGIPCFLQRSE